MTPRSVKKRDTQNVKKRDITAVDYGQPQEIVPATDVVTLTAVKGCAVQWLDQCKGRLEAYPDALNDDPMGRRAYAANLLGALSELDEAIKTLTQLAAQIASTPSAAGYADMGPTDVATATGISRQTADAWRNRPYRIDARPAPGVWLTEQLINPAKETKK
ncbi:hypothetical protein [Actinomyces faecalis]|uniref:hypothetical protein n=1 Tax=Actinomyces faecalis TaxID=2722820 RepID=UPI001884F8DC|nr:hypothetical protein [Actinomyces faecalis]